MKMRKSEFRNILDNGFLERRLASKERRAKGSEATKEWKLRQASVGKILERLEKSPVPEDQADKIAIKKLLELISYRF